MQRLASLLVTALIVALTGTVSAQQPTSETLVQQAAEYLKDLFPRLSNVVAEERYQQETTSPRKKRLLVSDYLIVRLETGDFASFRDVFQVDGKPVRDRDERLQKLFISAPAATAVQQAQRIADESARHNIWNIGTINNPYLAMAFIQDAYRQRFRLQSPRREKGEGPDVWAIVYQEFVTPTILHGNANRDMPARGRWWIDATTGRVVKTELRVGADSVASGLTPIQIETTFTYDEDLRLNVPSEMKEFYPLGRNGDVYGTASYGRFRRFGVTTEEEVKR
jgi:hypothetical protein